MRRNCTAAGWTDPLVPHEDACSYSFNETLHFFGEVGAGWCCDGVSVTMAIMKLPPPLIQSSDSHLYFSYVRTMYTAGYALSLVTLAIAIAIFSLFR